MVVIESIIEAIKELIDTYEGIDHTFTEVRLSYQKNAIPNPLVKTYVLLNPIKVSVIPYRDDYTSYTKQTTYKVGINIHCSESGNPSKLLELFSVILSALDDSTYYKPDEAVCGEIKSDSNTNSVYLPCSIQFVILS